MSAIIVGVDEAGRGALIGNVVAASVILPESYSSHLVVDSKSISEAKREKNSNYIREIALDIAIGVASPEEIDELNIHNATLLAMSRAIEGISSRFDAVWIDGKFAPACDKPTETFIKGDSLHDCISAASIIAKTYRDAELRELHLKHPQYGFAQHKGYATKSHKQALEQFGILPEHRKSYKTIKELIN